MIQLRNSNGESSIAGGVIYDKLCRTAQYIFDFDDIGNRKTAAWEGNQWILRSEVYAVNSVNQYASRTVPNGRRRA